MEVPKSARPEEVSTEWLLRPEGRPLFIFAHQDDETVLAGMIHRMVASGAMGRFVWWTNGDGLAPMVGADPREYAAIRMREAEDAVRALGGRAEEKFDLASSEIENYRRLTHVAQAGAVRDAALEYFRGEALRVEEQVRSADPDRVFLLAYQGGHPEHDLTHVMTVRAVKRLRRATGRPIPIAQVPAYEYTVVVALRFKPWFRGDRRRVELNSAEFEVKRKVFECYPSQQDLFKKFRRVMTAVGALGALRGKFVSVEQYLGAEEFGVIEPDFDYLRSSHRYEPMNYMFDDFEGIPIRFDTMVKPVVQDILQF
jgi:LmbE family N-acetylglucosaminyl deacetylase